MRSNLNFTFPFQKINKEQRIVTGIATADNLDLEDDVVNFEASVEAFSNWIGNIREMHSPIAVGKLIDWRVVPVIYKGKAYQGIEVSIYISKGAESTWQKILDGTLRGFSIGGSISRREKRMSEEVGRFVTEIMGYTLGELSVVDNPANPAGMFAMIKSVGGSLEYVAESVQDVFYCGKDNFVSVGGDSGCPTCDSEMLIIGKSEDYDNILVNKFIETIEHSFDKVISGVDEVRGDEDKSSSDSIEPDSLVDISSELVKSGDVQSLVQALAKDNDVVIGSLKNAFTIADAANQQGVCDLIAEKIEKHQKWALQLKVSNDVQEISIIGDIMVDENNDNLLLSKNTDKVDVMTEQDFTDIQKQTVLSKLGSFLFGKDVEERSDAIDVNKMNYTGQLTASTSPHVVVNIGGEVFEKNVSVTIPESSENLTDANEDLTGQGVEDSTLLTLEKSEDKISPEGEVEGEEMDFEKVLEGLGALLDEKLEKVKADITAEIDGKIDAIEKSVSEVKESAEELSSDLEKVANSGAEKKSDDVEADIIADEDVLQKSAASESFWGGLFVPAEIVKVLGYKS